MTAAPKDVAPEGRALQWNDLKTTKQRKIVSDNMRDAGTGLRDTVRTAHERLTAKVANPDTASAARSTAAKEARSLRAIEPHLRPHAVTLQGAANTRQGLYNDAIDRRSQATGGEHVIPDGTGWYFEHHARIAHEAEKYGFPTSSAIAAAAVMSPQNAPEKERRAVAGMMDTMSNHQVTVTPEVQSHLAKTDAKGNGAIDVSQHLGKTVHFDQLPEGSMAKLSDSKIASQVPTNAPLFEVAQGFSRTNITKGERLLMGEVDPHKAVNPHSAPKVWSYNFNTQQAVPGSADHVEFVGRVQQDAMVRKGLISSDQQSLDLYGHGEKTGGHMLSPKSHTVEDTWQNAATFNQPKKLVSGSEDRSGRASTSVFKAAGSLPQTYPVAGVKTRANETTGKRESAFTDSDVKDSAITHAFNNRATQKGAEQQSKQSGVTVPPVAMQEVGWTEMRKQAGKSRDAVDSSSNRVITPKDYQTEVDVHRRMGRTVPTGTRENSDPAPSNFEIDHGSHVRGQQALWGDHVPGGERPRASLPGAEEHPDLTPAQHEGELRKWAAIGNNVAKGRMRAEPPLPEFKPINTNLGRQF